jgi:chaperone LolA
MTFGSVFGHGGGKKRRVALALVAISLCGSSRAVPLDAVLARLERAEKEIHSLRFDFSQTTTLALDGRAVVSRGTASFERPNRFRLEMSSPEVQTIVSDGKVLWVYLPARAQVLRDSMDNWFRSAGFPKGLTPFRMDVSEMKKKYRFVLEEDGPKPVLSLTPIEGESLEYTLRLWVNLETGLAEKTELASENVTAVVTVGNVRVNPARDPGAFRFVPPPDASVMEMPLN